MKKIFKKCAVLTTLFAMVLSILPTYAVNVNDIEPIESIKQRVSSIYQIPMDVLDTLDESYIRDLDVDYSQVLSTQEQYVKFSVDKVGKVIATPASKTECLNDINKPSTYGLISDEAENAWIRIYVVMIDQGNFIDISSTYDWITTPQVRAGAYDLLSIRFENGTYVPNSASGFYSYNYNGTTKRSNLTGFEPASNSWKQMNCAFKLNDGVLAKEHFAQMKVTIIKNVGAKAERAMSIYGHQEKNIDWTSVLGGAATIGDVAASFTEVTTSGALLFVSGVASILGSASNYYNSFKLEIFAEWEKLDMR